MFTHISLAKKSYRLLFISLITLRYGITVTYQNSAYGFVIYVDIFSTNCFLIALVIQLIIGTTQTEKMVTASLIIDTFKSNMVVTATILDDIIVTTRSHYQPECPVFGIDTMERYWSKIWTSLIMVKSFSVFSNHWRA